jgi:RNA polymerase sigma-70 factor (ECF subfamily)
LLSIARRVVIDHIRAASVRPRQARVDWQFVAERHQPIGLPGIDERVALAQLVDCLTVERRDAFVLTQILGLSYVEAAEVCDCPVGTIRSRLSRARDDLVALWTSGDLTDDGTDRSTG